LRVFVRYPTLKNSLPWFYRIFLLGQDGYIKQLSEIFESTDDQTAIEKAIQFLDGSVIEICESYRLVSRLYLINNYRRHVDDILSSLVVVAYVGDPT
jgi:hypothetical protein